MMDYQRMLSEAHILCARENFNVYRIDPIKVSHHNGSYYVFDKEHTIEEILDLTLRLCVGTWEGEINSLSGNILNGIARMIYAYGENLREDVFKDRVGQLSIKILARTAKERRPGALGYAEAMVMAYNKRAKYRLPMSRLYTHNSRLSVDEEDAADEYDEEGEDLTS